MSTVICFECKSEVSSGSENCPECGFPFDSVSPSKCPECANEVVFSSGSCPECGFPVEALDEMAKEGLLQEEAAPAPHLELVRPAHPDATAMEQLCSETSAANELLRGHLSSLNELMVNIASYVDTSRNSNAALLGDLYGGIEKFLADAERIKAEMAESVTQQNAHATAAVQEMVASFTEEMKSVVDEVNSAKESAVTAINSAAEQAKADLSAVENQLQAKLGSTLDYIFYLSLGLLFFVALNIAVGCYVVKVVKQAEPADHAAVQVEEKHSKPGH